jgi:hypothetical protein
LDHEVKKATGGSFLLARKCLTSGRKRFPSYAAWNWWPVACSFHCNKCQSFMNHCPAHQPLSHDLKTKIIISYQTPTFDTSMSGFFFSFFFIYGKYVLNFLPPLTKLEKNIMLIYPIISFIMGVLTYNTKKTEISYDVLHYCNFDKAINGFLCLVYFFQNHSLS